ncbi:uncharacterized protein LOC135498610 isoform X1 [Lineus longissimus]|uniref:uncharacterized protein LOC135498610 isoform X1 n=1 Tax=Lineus longissimus TaxID=88925 RepID=UPI00315DA62F
MADSRDVTGGPGPPEQSQNRSKEKKRRHGHSSGSRVNVKDGESGYSENRGKTERVKSKEAGSEPISKCVKAVDSVGSGEKKGRTRRNPEEEVPRNGAGDCTSGDQDVDNARDETTQERERLGREAEADRRTNISAQGEIEQQNSADRKGGNNQTNTEHGKNKSEPDSENIGKERPVSGQTAARNQKEKLVKEHTRSYSDGGAVFVSPRRQRSDSNGQHSDQGIYDNEHAEVVLSRSRSLKYDRQGSRADFPPRLLVVSSKIKNIMSLQNALLPQVTFLQYKFETSTFDGLIGLIGQFLLNKKFHSVALVLHGPVGVIQLCGKEEKPLNKDTVLDHAGIRGFFSKLFSLHGNKEAANLRLDFLACNAAQGQDGGQGIVKELEALLGVSVGLSRDIVGAELVKDPSSKSTVGELYFRLECLRGWSGHYQQSMAGFEKIRTVGKGAYGAAVLYRKRDDDSLVILKEINMHDLNAAERQLALNEVKVLAVLDHPNIISYYDSFEEDGVLMIEMEYANGGEVS